VAKKVWPQDLNPPLQPIEWDWDPLLTPLSKVPPRFTPSTKITFERLEELNFGPKDWLSEEEFHLLAGEGVSIWAGRKRIDEAGDWSALQDSDYTAQTMADKADSDPRGDPWCIYGVGEGDSAERVVRAEKFQLLEPNLRGVEAG
jgi:hypothetical protein